MSKEDYIKASGKAFTRPAMTLALMAQVSANAEDEKDSKSSLVLDEITVTTTPSAKNMQCASIHAPGSIFIECGYIASYN